MKTYRPEALISFDTFVPDWIEKRLGMRIPEVPQQILIPPAFVEGDSVR